MGCHVLAEVQMLDLRVIFLVGRATPGGTARDLGRLACGLPFLAADRRSDQLADLA